MSDRSNYDRLCRVEMEVELLLADVREQVRGLRDTVERMRALRGSPAESGHGRDRGPGYSGPH